MFLQANLVKAAETTVGDLGNAAVVYQENIVQKFKHRITFQAAFLVLSPVNHNYISVVKNYEKINGLLVYLLLDG